MRLYDIAEAIEALLADETVLDADGVLTPDGEQQLDALNASLEQRVLDVAAYALSERAEAEAVEAQAKRLRERAARHERRAASLENYLARHLTPGSQRIADERVEVAWRKSQAVEVDDGKLEAKWWREKVERAPDKVALRAALADGATIDGARMVTRWALKVK